jgi:hypothetical protein
MCSIVVLFFVASLLHGKMLTHRSVKPNVPQTANNAALSDQDRVPEPVGVLTPSHHHQYQRHGQQHHHGHHDQQGSFQTMVSIQVHSAMQLIFFTVLSLVFRLIKFTNSLSSSISSLSLPATGALTALTAQNTPLQVQEPNNTKKKTKCLPTHISFIIRPLTSQQQLQPHSTANLNTSNMTSSLNAINKNHPTPEILFDVQELTTILTWTWGRSHVTCITLHDRHGLLKTTLMPLLSRMDLNTLCLTRKNEVEYTLSLKNSDAGDERQIRVFVQDERDAYRILDAGLDVDVSDLTVEKVDEYMNPEGKPFSPFCFLETFS